MQYVMENFSNECTDVSCSQKQNSFFKGKHTGTGEVCSTENTLAARSLLCVQRCGCLGSHERDDRCLSATPHLLGRATRGNQAQYWLHTPIAQWLQKLAWPHQLQHQLVASSVRQIFNIAHVITLRSQHQHEGQSNQQNPLTRMA